MLARPARDAAGSDGDWQEPPPSVSRVSTEQPGPRPPVDVAGLRGGFAFS